MGSLININGAPLEKLIDVMSRGFGVLYSPREIRKNADAKAYEIKVLEKAKLAADLKRTDKTSELEQKISARITHQEAKRQQNIDNISYVAAKQLEQEETVSEEQVDEDWISRFFNISQDVSNEEMQTLWGRILAGEVKQPNSFSLRTLEILKNITHSEAEVFNRLAKMRLEMSNSAFISYNNNSKRFVSSNFDLKYEHILLMQDIGLLSASNSSVLYLPPDRALHIISGEKILLIDSEIPNRSLVTANVLIFTNSGFELSKLIKSESNVDYLRIIREEFNGRGIELKIELCDILERNSDSINMSDPIPFD